MVLSELQEQVLTVVRNHPEGIDSSGIWGECQRLPRKAKDFVAYTQVANAIQKLRIMGLIRSERLSSTRTVYRSATEEPMPKFLVTVGGIGLEQLSLRQAIDAFVEATLRGEDAVLSTKR